MAEDLHSLESLQALHADLVALYEKRLSNIERLGFQLENHIEAFKALLDKKPRSEPSRQTLAKGTITIRGEDFSVNDKFKEGTLQVADNLDLDELDAAALFHQAQTESGASGRSDLTCSVIRFHQRRKELLDCLRIALQIHADPDQELLDGDGLQVLVERIAQPESVRKNATFTARCLSSMLEIRTWLRRLYDKIDSLPVTGQTENTEEAERLEYERASLIKQHESLATILFYLAKSKPSKEDFTTVLNTLKSMDKLDHTLIHYFPVMSVYISSFGGQDGGTTREEASKLGQTIMETRQSTWALPYVHAAVRCWWLAEYSTWFGEHNDNTLSQDQLDAASEQRSEQFNVALKDGAFDLLMSLSADVKSRAWSDPARHGLRIWLQRKAPSMAPDLVAFSDYFQEALMEQFESFIEGFITNLPDVLRKMRANEDEQRQANMSDHDLDLERFLLIVSYTYEDRPRAAYEAFWDVPDGALMGFLNWASRRASTPLMSAFCEMLQSISQDEDCATSAHLFLLDEGAQSSKTRRSHSLTWAQIIHELTLFCTQIRDRPAAPQSYGQIKPNTGYVDFEPESFMMLECYLRVISRLCGESVEARLFLAQHPTFHITDALLQLTSSSIQTRVKACAFTTLRSLLSQKTRSANNVIWTALDVWVCGGFSPGSSTNKSSSLITAPMSQSSIQRILRGMGTGFEEPNAFIKLLCALVSPCEDESESGLHDSLPFPERLGDQIRMPGIGIYIDFALERIFAAQEPDIQDIAQLRIIQLTCLDLIATCLDTFNEDLVIFANQSNVMVDNAIQTSNLRTYVILHPFARVMEWMFNEKVMKALFSAVHQNAAEVGSSEPDSPLVLCVLRGIHVISLILDLQSTYLGIIRPLVQQETSQRQASVSDGAFTSFEDGIINHLSIVVDLGRYCSAGQPELVIAALKLLGKLSSSPKLASTTTRNRIISAFEVNDDSGSVSQSLVHEMKSPVDINLGQDHSAYIIKSQILDFILSCLKASPGQPTIAHLFLGFHCRQSDIDIIPDSPFTQEISLFHAILDIAVMDPVGEDDSLVSSWLVSLKHKAYQVLSHLWQAPLSANMVLNDIRPQRAFVRMFTDQITLGPNVLFDGVPYGNRDDMLASSASDCLAEFLGQRGLVLQYVSLELQQAVRIRLSTLKAAITRTLLGSTIDGDGQATENSTIFDLFDFIEIDFGSSLEIPFGAWASDMDLSVCLDSHGDDFRSYNLKRVHELLLLRRAELLKHNLLPDQQQLDAVNDNMNVVIGVCGINNRLQHIAAARLKLLGSWVHVVLMIIESGEFKGPEKTSLVLRTLQTILPAMENRLDYVEESLELAKLAKALIFCLDFESESFRQGDMGDLVADRLFHLYQVSLRAINLLGANPALKEIFYNISYRYLTGMSDIANGINGVQRRHSTKTIKAAGERFIELICDDAHSGEPMCRISALLLLGAFTKLAQKENSKYIVESLSRLNFIVIMVGSIQNFSAELEKTPPEYVHMQLSYCNAKLALLLHLSQTRSGASAVLNAGLFHSIKDSRLFEVDPDLGIDIDAPDAVSLHYGLLVSVMRVICATVLSRGSQNEQTLEMGRTFLTENKLSILAVLKKSAGIGIRGDSTGQSLEDLADSYMLLMSLTGFLDLEETTPKRMSSKAFT